MSIPTSLRLCCQAVMVPALTEAAQSRVRLGAPSSREGDRQGGVYPSQPSTASMSGTDPPLNNRGHSSENNTSSKGIGKSASLNVTSTTVTINNSAVRSIPATSLYGLKVIDSKDLKVVDAKSQVHIMGANGTAKHEVHKRPVSGGRCVAGRVYQGLVANQKGTMVQQGQILYQTPAGLVNGPPATLHPVTNGVGTVSPRVPPGRKLPNIMGLKLAPTGITASSGGIASPLVVSSHAPVPHKQLAIIKSVPSVETQASSLGNKVEAVVDTELNKMEMSTKRQLDLERRAERLVRRIRRLQSRQSVSHVQRELSAFVDYQSNEIQSATGVPRASNPKDVETQLLQSENVKNLSTAALVSLVRRLQSTNAQALQQRLTNAAKQPDPPKTISLEKDACYEMKRVAGLLRQSLHHVQSALDSDATESSSGAESCDEMEDYDDRKPDCPINRRPRFRWAVDRAAIASRWTWLQAQVSDLEYRIRQQNDIYRQIRTTKGPVLLGEHPGPEDILAKYRSKPGRRLSPIEQKIVNLERKNEVSPCPLSTLLSNTDKQSAKLLQSLGNVFSPAAASKSSSPRTPNGLLEPGSSTSSHIGSRDNSDTESTDTSTHKKPKTEPCVGDSPQTDDACQAARCRPVRTYRKRKLFRTSGLYQIHRKAARLSTVRCHCYPPVTPCPMCGGRYNNTQTLAPDVMPMAERVALLDNSYHPVLSFPQDAGLPLQFEALLRSGEWQSKPQQKVPRLLHTDRKHVSGLGAEKKRKYTRRVNKSASAAVLSSTKIKNKYEQKQLGRSLVLPGTPKRGSGDNSRLRHADIKLKKRKATAHAVSNLKKRERSASMSGRLNGPSTPTCKDGGSPSLSSSQSRTFQDMKEHLKKRRGESAFDINNIVIPYCIAASTRVEKLQYKEIITPRWRRIGSELKKEEVGAGDAPQAPTPKENGLPEKTLPEVAPPEPPSEVEPDIEDLSDELFTDRHRRCEAEEKKRFLTFVQIEKRGGARGGRLDSTNSQGPSTVPETHVPTAENTVNQIMMKSESSLSLKDMADEQQGKVEKDLKVQKEVKQEKEVKFEKDDSETEDSLSTEELEQAEQNETKFRSRVSNMQIHNLSDLDDQHEDNVVNPWPKRLFPLSEEEFHTMLKGDIPTPVTVQPARSTRRSLECDAQVPRKNLLNAASSTANMSGTASPMLTSSDDEAAIEDPNDPEWTVVTPGGRPQKTSGLVLKLSKR